MLPLRILPALLLLAVPAFSAIDLAIHPGSTRDWVKRVESSNDSVLYRLEFLDSTSRDSSGVGGGYNGIYQKADTTIDWRVRVTRSDSPTVSDTAVLRVLRSRWAVHSDSRPDIEERRIQGFAYWLKPSRHFPIDLQFHSETEDKSLSGILPNGIWEVLLLEEKGIDWAYWLDRDGDKICTKSLGGGFCRTFPFIASRDSLGIVVWQNNGATWELRGVDGAILPPLRGSLGHPLRKGECWVYRDSSDYDYTSMGKHVTSRTRAFVSLELLSAPSDSAGWMRLLVRESKHPDSGAFSDTTYAILLDTLHTIARVGRSEMSPSNLEGGVHGWALSLMKHPMFPDTSKSRYSKSFSHSEGEVPSSGSSFSLQISFDYGIGATSITSRSSSWGVGSEIGSSYSYWTLVTHSLDNIPLTAIAAPARPTRDLSWLRTRIAQDPSLEVVRIRLDGARTTARGAEGSRLLERRGVGIMQVRDGQELVTLRVVKP